MSLNQSTTTETACRRQWKQRQLERMEEKHTGVMRSYKIMTNVSPLTASGQRRNARSPEILASNSMAELVSMDLSLLQLQAKPQTSESDANFHIIEE